MVDHLSASSFPAEDIARLLAGHIMPLWECHLHLLEGKPAPSFGQGLASASGDNAFVPLPMPAAPAAAAATAVNADTEGAAGEPHQNGHTAAAAATGGMWEQTLTKALPSCWLGSGACEVSLLLAAAVALRFLHQFLGALPAGRQLVEVWVKVS